MTSIQHNNPDETIDPLAEDNDPPFSMPTAPAGDPDDHTDSKPEENQLDPTHPATDSESDLDLHEQYDEGLSEAAEASEPSAGNDVVKDYDPDNDDQRNNA